MGLSRVNAPKDLFAGLIYIVVGGGAFILAHDYDMGTLLQMGPGLFPALIGATMVALGGGLVFNSFRHGNTEPMVKLHVEPLVLILVGAWSFSFLIERAGLVVAIGALLFFACFRRLLTNPIEVLLTFAALAFFSAGVFVYGFGMPLPVFWWQQ